MKVRFSKIKGTVVDPMMFGALAEAPYHNVLEGKLFECCDLLEWIGGTYDSKGLKASRFENSPTEFTVEHWTAKEDNLYEWQLKSKTHWSGVKWLDAAHTTDGGDRMCAGIATFVCEKKEVEEIEDGPIVKIPEKEKYPQFELKRILQQQLPEPRHCAGYMG